MLKDAKLHHEAEVESGDISLWVVTMSNPFHITMDS